MKALTTARANSIAGMRQGTPPDWVELWLHNARWLYSIEVLRKRLPVSAVPGF